jgi:sigma-54-interacting transcriptional regulator
MPAISPSNAVVSFSEAGWLQFLISDRRPNLLVSCHAGEIQAVAARLMSSCTPPLHIQRLPGRLVLPVDLACTLLLWDVAQLTLDQQIHLNDWMAVRRQQTQVISVTTTPLASLVEEGRFLEGLLHRLNVVSLFAQGW